MSASKGRWWRWLYRIPLILILLIVVLVGAAFGLLQTDWGRGLAKTQVEKILDGILVGEVRIGRIDGFLPIRPLVRDVVVTDAKGREAISARAIAAEISFVPFVLGLLDQRVGIDTVTVLGPDVLAVTERDGQMNLAQLVVPTPEDPNAKPWTIAVETARVDDGRVRMMQAVGGSTTTIDRIEARAALEMTGPSGAINLPRLAAHLHQPDMTVELAARADTSSTAVEVRDLVALVDGRPTLIDGGMSLVLATGKLRATADALVEPALLTTVTGDANWRARARLDAAVWRPTAELPWRIRLGGRLNDGPFTISATAAPDFSQVMATVALDDVDPRRVYRTLPHGQLGLRVEGNVTGQDPETLRGHLRGEIAGDISTSTATTDRHPLLLTLSGEADAGKIYARFDGRSSGARVRGEAALDARAKPMVVSRAHATLAANDMARIPLGETALAGAMTATVSAQGTVEDLALEVKANATDLQFGDTRAERLRLTGNLSGLPARTEGRINAEVRNLRQNKQRIGHLKIDARGEDGGRAMAIGVKLEEGQLPKTLAANLRVERDPKETRILVRNLDARTNNLSWRMENARASIAADGRIDVENLALVSSAGSLSLEAELDSDPLVGPGWAKAALSASNFGLVRADLMPKSPGIEGRGNITLDARMGPKAHAKLIADLSDVKYPGMTRPAQATAVVNLVSGALTASVAMSGPEVGSLSLTARVRAPRKPLDPVGWARVDGHDVEQFEADLDGVDLSRLAPLFPEAGLLAGRVEGKIRSTPGLETLTLDLEGRGIRHTHSPGPIDVDVEGRSDDERTRFTLAAGVGGTPLAAIALHLSEGAADLATNPQRALSPKTNALLEVDLDDFPIALLADLRIEPPGITLTSVRHSYRGELTVKGRVERKSRKLSGDVMLAGTDLVWVEGAPPVTATVSVALNDNQVAVHVIGEGRGFGGLDMALTGRTPIDALDAKAWNKLGTDALHTLTLDTNALDLGAIDRITNRRFPIKGRLDARIIASRGLRKLDGRVEMRGLAARDSQTVSDSFITLTSGDRRTDIEIDIAHKNQKVLTATASIDVDVPQIVQNPAVLDDAPMWARMDVAALPLEALAKSLSLSVPLGGTLTATAAIEGTLTDYRGSAHIDGARAEVKGQKFEHFTMDVEIDPRIIRAHATAKERGTPGTLELDARLGLTPGGTVDARLVSKKFRIDFLSAFFQRQQAVGGVTGVLDADLTLSGTPDAPDARGKVDVSDMSLVLAPPVPAIERTRVNMSFDGSKVTAKIDGKSGEGSLTGSADVEFTTLLRPKFDVRIETDALPVVAGPRLALVDAVVTVKGRVDDAFRADVLIDDAVVEVVNEGTDSLKPIRDFNDVIYTDDNRKRTVMGQPVAPEAMPILVSVKTTRDVAIRGKEVTATAYLDIRADGTGGVLSNEGKVSIGDGWVTFFGKRWEIRRADITMMGVEEPRLDIEISREVGNALVFVRVRGTPLAPELEMASDPPIYDDAQMLMFVLGADPSTGDEATLQDKAAGAAASALVGAVQSKIEDKLPFDTIKLDLEDGAKLARLTVGKWISRRIFVGYEFAFEAEQNENTNEALLQFRLGRGWLVESRYGDRGEGGVDVIWVKRF